MATESTTSVPQPPRSREPAVGGGSSGFFFLCMVHAAVAVGSGALMMFSQAEAYAWGHGREAAARLLRSSTPRDELLIRTSDAFAGLLLCAVGALIFMAGFARDREFQAFFAKGCALLHAAAALWRVHFERRLEELERDWPRQLVGDLVLALSWVLFLAYSWREKYD